MNPVASATKVVTVPVAAIKSHPLVWLVFFVLVAAVILRYRTTVAGWLTGAPIVGSRADGFINRTNA